MRGVLVTAACAGFVSLAGCGGGGGGDSGGSVSSNPVVYVGNSSAAVITATNAGALAANLTGNGSAVSSGLSVAGHAQFPDAGQAEVARRLNRGVRRGVALPRNESGRLAMAIPVDETQPCDSGSTRVSGTLADDGTGTLAVAFNNCRTGDDTLSGSATMRVDAISGDTITDFTLAISRIALRGPGLSADVGGSLRSHLNLATNTETITENTVVLDNLTGRMTRSENLVLVDVYNNLFSPSSYLETVTGRIYDSVHGFVDIATLVQLSFGTLAQDFPDSGVVQLTGANGAIIRVTAISSSVVMLALDLDANSTFETAATLNWNDLAGPAGANLADSDNDGMHDSWEIAKNLNPNNAADAASDADGDGAGNLMEYLAGSNPNDVLSTPPIAGLSVSATDAPDPVAVGANLTYTFTVTNANASLGTNVVLTVTLPAGVNFVSATPPQGSCAGTGPVVCSLGTAGPFANLAVVVIVSPTATSPLITASASVTASSFDPASGDNTASATTTVGSPLTAIQAMIDAASDGATVQVPQGLYVGNLNFGGKNIVLESIAGPAATIIHGSNGTAVHMGPGGTLRGFTITGSQPVLGAVHVFAGAGPVISGNIFDGNQAPIGGVGAAIGGNSSVAPLIERNIFRNNSCDNQNLAGVVSFFNASSPQLYNNVFENNQCRAINVSAVGAADAVVVINNTFVNNRTAVTGLRTGVPTSHVYRNNIIVQNGVGLDLQAGSPVPPPTWENNLVIGSTTADYLGTANQTGINGNISADPLFVNQAGGDYHLLPGSQAIDAGSATGAPATDFAGTLRPQGAAFDIGAFEAIP